MALFMWGELGSKKPQIIHEFNVYPSCPLKNNVLLHSFSDNIVPITASGPLG